MRDLFVVFFIGIACASAMAQGKLLLVGGGSENPGGWSDAPYQWFVEQAENKRIAVISTNAGNDPSWLPNYFTSLGADNARNFEFPSRASAQAAHVYDSLMSYDGIFFKGGDQWLYYQYFNDTPVEKAVIDKYGEKGVMGGTSAGMAILGEYCYTAQNQSLLPWEALENIYHPNITIEEEFMPLLKGFITDTHFLERGRLPRLAAMLGNYQLINNISINGIASDDQTAIAISEDLLATVHGNGGVYIFGEGQFSEADDKWSGKQNTIHLSDGMSINLNNLQVVNGPAKSTAVSLTESTHNPILLCGEDPISENSPCALELAMQEDTMMILTGESRLVAAELLNAINKLGKTDVFVLSATPDNNDEDLWKLRNRIRRTKNVVFINNDFEALQNFLDDGPTGQLIKSHIQRDEIFSAFWGEDVKLAGGAYCNNNLDAANLSFNGNLEYTDGLQLLPNTILMSDPYPFSTTDFYENNTLSGLFALSEHSLAYAIYLGNNSLIRFNSEDGFNYYEGNGQQSAMIVVNTSEMHEQFNIPAGSAARNNASFDKLEVHFLNNDSRLNVGETVVSENPDYEFEIPEEEIITSLKELQQGVQIYPTISNGQFNILLEESSFVRILGVHGNVHGTYLFQSGKHQFQIQHAGVYILHIYSATNSTLIKSQKIVKF